MHTVYLQLGWGRWPTLASPDPLRGALAVPDGRSRAHGGSAAIRERFHAMRKRLEWPAAEAPSFLIERQALEQAHLPWPQACPLMNLLPENLSALLTYLHWHQWPSLATKSMAR